MGYDITLIQYYKSNSKKCHGKDYNDYREV